MAAETTAVMIGSKAARVFPASELNLQERIDAYGSPSRELKKTLAGVKESI